MRSQRLGRQILETFGDEGIEDQVMIAVSQAGPFVNPESTEFFMYFANSVSDFFARVDESYLQMESKLEVANRNLEVSSEELFQANESLNEMNQNLDAILNSLGQAILLFERNGICLNLYSAKCREILNCVPAGMHIQDILRIPPAEQEFLANWLDALFEENVEFEQVAALGPTTIPNEDNRRILLEYRPVRDELGKISHVVLVASDKTIEYESQEKFEKMKAYVSRITQFLKSRDESIKRYEQMELLLEKIRTIPEPYSVEYRNEALRLLHTAKSLAAMMDLVDVKKYIHESEEKLKFLDAGDFVSSLKKTVQTIGDALQEAKYEAIHFVSKDTQDSRGGMEQGSVKKFANEIKMKQSWKSEEILGLFADHFILEPASKYLLSFQGMCNDLAGKYGKKISRFVVIGDFKIYPEYWSDLVSVLGHVFSNIIVHGIEEPHVRRGRGKSEEGHIKVSLNKSADHYHFMIEDDGGGLDPELILKKYQEGQRGYELGTMSRHDILQLIFTDGLSTKEQSDEDAGRGMGLAALREVVNRLEGQIVVESELGYWTRFTITIPSWRVNQF